MHSPNSAPFQTEPERFEKYWQRRYTYFSRFDDGIRADGLGLYFAKAEQCALCIAKRARGRTVVDAFCGLGVTAIAFARAGLRVIAIDLDARRLEMARANISVYGLSQRVTFIQGDAISIVPNLQFDTIYLDPPWGKPGQIKAADYLLVDFDPNITGLVRFGSSRGARVLLTVPPQFRFDELRCFGNAVNASHSAGCCCDCYTVVIG